MPQESKIAIIGAGPAGLGAAWALHKMSYRNWVLYEASDHVGGLCASFRDRQGFMWDYGGHIIFGEPSPFQDFIKETLRDEVIEHTRSTFINCDGALVPQPFEDNLECLPDDKMVECFVGLARQYGLSQDRTSFLSFLQTTFGAGICRQFMIPYNEKVWAFPLDQMGVAWLKNRVCVTDFRRSLLQAIERGWKRTRDVGGGWGPNKTFTYPRKGGAGEPYRKFLQLIRDKVIFNTRVHSISLDEKCLTTMNGTSTDYAMRVDYDHLISTIPLPGLLACLYPRSVSSQFIKRSWAWNNLLLVNLGVSTEKHLNWHWMFFPDKDVPFHRIVNHGSYSADNLPGGDQDGHTALICEVSYGQTKPRPDHIIEQVIAGCISKGVLKESDRAHIVSSQVVEVPCAYPICTKTRDKDLLAVQQVLGQHNVYSVGRYGGWRYEEGNQDHAFVQGYNAALGLING